MQPRIEPYLSSEPLPVADARPALALRFVGSGSEYFRIWIVNLLLTVVTVGFYYPFAKVRRLRYFHGATEIGGYPLSYHADPWKMLRGYVLVGLLFAAYNIAGQVSPEASTIAVLLIAAIAPMLWHSALRFRMANTGWRGLRMRYTGTRGQAYRVAAIPLVMMVAIVFGMIMLAPRSAKPDAADMLPLIVLVFLPWLLVPAIIALLIRQIHKHLAYGDQHSRFDVGIGAFYRSALRTGGLSLVAVLVLGAAVIGLIVLLGAIAASSGKARGELLVPIMALAVASMALAVPAHFAARLQNLVWSNTRSEHLSLTSRLSARSLVMLTLRNAALIVVSLGLYYPFAKVATARLRLEAIQVEVLGDLDAITRVDDTRAESAVGDASGDLFGFDVGL